MTQAIRAVKTQGGFGLRLSSPKPELEFLN